jgi:type IV secretion system protein VirB7
MLRQLTLLAALSVTAGGCASLGPIGAPGCDGFARRPLNRSLWAWEEGAPVPPSPSTGEPSDAPALRRKAAALRSTPDGASLHGAERIARTTIDIASSLQACGGTPPETRHG